MTSLERTWRDLLNPEGTARRIAQQTWTPDIQTLLEETVEDSFCGLLLYQSVKSGIDATSIFYDELNALPYTSLLRLRDAYHDIIWEGFLLAEAAHVVEPRRLTARPAIATPSKRRKCFKENVGGDYTSQIKNLHGQIHGDLFSKFYEPYLESKLGLLWDDPPVAALPAAFRSAVRSDFAWLYNRGFGANYVEHTYFNPASHTL